MTTARGGKKKDKNKDLDSLMNSMKKHQRAIGDDGYKGEPVKITITRRGDSAEVKKFTMRLSMAELNSL
jgi:hypothetical protein